MLKFESRPCYSFWQNFYQVVILDSIQFKSSIWWGTVSKVFLADAQSGIICLSHTKQAKFNVLSLTVVILRVFPKHIFLRGLFQLPLDFQYWRPYNPKFTTSV